MRTLQTALEMYYADNGQYPSSTNCSPSSSLVNSVHWCNSVTGLSGGRWIASGALAPYLPQDPIDPTPDAATVWNNGANDNGGVYYYYSSSDYQGCIASQYYFIIAGMEIVSNRKNVFRFCNGTTYTSGGSYIIGNVIQ